MQRLLIRLIHVYRRVLSPVIGQQCRFTPSCSRYTEEAIELYGAGRGSWMGFKRILRCQPLCAGGHDPVPGSDSGGDTGSDSGSDSRHDRDSAEREPLPVGPAERSPRAGSR